MAQGGAIGIMIDAPYWRPDVPPPSKGKEAESERDNYIQMVVDLRCAVDVLVSRKDVDPNRIGYVGHSLGATWGAFRTLRRLFMHWSSRAKASRLLSAQAEIRRSDTFSCSGRKGHIPVAALPGPGLSECGFCRG
jgi:hypothetical protein